MICKNNINEIWLNSLEIYWSKIINLYKIEKKSIHYFKHYNIVNIEILFKMKH